MKISSFILAGKATYGLVNDEQVFPATANLQEQYADLRALLAANATDQLADHVEATGVAIDDVTMLPTIPNPDKVICVGLNYVTHIEETGKKAPAYPILFTRFPASQVGHNEALVRPKVSSDFDYEGELAVIIGEACRHVSKEDAMSKVAGYACFNDGSIRDYQWHTTQFGPGKWFDKSGSVGPWMVTADEAGNPEDMHLQTRLNGKIMQDTSVNDLLFDVPALIEYISTIVELLPGDIIATGTTGGVAAFHTPPAWMKDGDTIEVEISGIGILSNNIIDE